VTGPHIGSATGPVPLTSAALGQLAGTGSDHVALPRYDRERVTAGIVHFGVGGFHRAHQAMYLDALLNAGLANDWGICGVGLLPADRRMAEVLRAQDCLYSLLEKAPDGSRRLRVIGSVVDYRYAPEQPADVLDALSSPQIRIVTLTVTEAGYNLHRVTGEFVPSEPRVVADLAHPDRPTTVFGFLVEALARRRAAGVPPFTVVSCDNVQGNGHVTRTAVAGFARLRDAELGSWIDAHVAFPNSMVDRITPATDEHDRTIVREQFGIDDAWPVVCEPFSQWVIEDDFPLGRPPLEQAGVQVVSDVEPYELMKLRLLNASHQALGYAGYLAGYRYVHEATADPAFAEFVRSYMREEAIPSLRPVRGVDLEAYVEEIIARFANREIRDTLARVCVDASERIPKFLLPVVRHQLGTGGPVDRSIAVLACWARFAEGADERGEPIDIVDPARAVVTAAARRQRSEPLAFVRNRDIFGDLADDPRFTASYLRTLTALRNDGARATIQALAATTSWHE
jgi:mannitol 2-dehydrogenase